MQPHPHPSTNHHPIRRRVRRRRSIIAAVSAMCLALFGLLVTTSGPALAAVISLPGSNFEIDEDANLTVDNPAPSLDWANVAETRKADKPTGATDDSFGQGSKEDTPSPAVVDGSIPNNKSDLKTFGVYLESNASGKFLNVFWTRVQEPTGTTNMDFEFNQSSALSANGVTPVRTAGDALIQYDLTSGGTHPELFLSKWVATGPGSQCEANNTTPCWGTRVNLSDAGDATGSINTTPITAANADGLGALSARTFGEAQIDFSVLAPPGKCTSFGSAYLKSRSSDSFTAALKDFIAPTPTNLNNCAQVIIRKQTDPQMGSTSPDFNYTKSFATDPATGNTFSLKDDGVKDYGKTVLFGTGLTVTEDLPLPTNWVFVSIDCNVAGHPSVGVTPSISGRTVTFDLDADTDVLDCTYNNKLNLGAILVTKTAKHAADGPGPHPQAGVTFTVDGVSKQTDANGQVCFDGLAFGSHNVTETVPTGYVADGATTKSVLVDNSARCSDNPYGGETVSFSNTPLTDVSITVNSQVNGGTATTVDCDDNSLDGTTNADGDGTFSTTNEQPHIITCTINIDP
jgi:hypothetical protein